MFSPTRKRKQAFPRRRILRRRGAAGAAAAVVPYRPRALGAPLGLPGRRIRYGRDRSVRTTRVPRFPSGVYGFPDKLMMKLTWAETGTLNTTGAPWYTTHHFKLNDMFDPSGQSATQPNLYDEIFGPIYIRCLVHAALVNVEAYEVSGSPAKYLAAFPSTGTTDGNDHDSLLASPQAQVVHWPAGTDGPAQSKRISYYVRFKDVRPTDQDSDYGHAYNASPTKFFYYLIKAGDVAHTEATNVKYHIHVTFWFTAFSRTVAALD